MKIVCDKNMPYAFEAFRTLGDVLLKDGRQITPDDVRDAELLIIRSTTKVNAALLDNSRVRFCGSGIIGMDHLDIPYLEAHNIAWTVAPGCNAESVANYVTASLLWLAGQHAFTLRGKTIGIIGVGNIGKRVYRHAQALGLRVLANDPPRKRNPHDHDAQTFADLDQVLAESDIITCHVPLTREGPDATHHLFTAERFSQLKPGALFINAARGAVVDTDALMPCIGTRIRHLVIDCWEGEPAYRTDLAKRVDLGTPHIAGHAYEGKVNGTAIVYEKACAFLGVPATFDFVLPEPPTPLLTLDARNRSDEAVLREAVLSIYDIEADSQRLLTTCCEDAQARATAFDAQRRDYPMRRQFTATRIQLIGGSAFLKSALTGLGFQLCTA